MIFFLSSDGQHAEIVDDARSARRLLAGVFEQLCGRLPSQTGEPREQRLAGGVGQIPRSCQALCQPHHQTEVSLPNSGQTTQEFLLSYQDRAISSSLYLQANSSSINTLSHAKTQDAVKIHIFHFLYSLFK